ncbi:hypothetical protein [Halobiforma nitratireducens]|uniref:Uncharacterized protein n=1 Tax=Halobiforma nitratireducens JCM 10879 TaxID=1227454 RepID=M0LE78_9EURY|nr:hypothetical protein [Halobiforma nitratireducens]EMA31413.1 hypothetical protein C446_15638 [Halobiforma nitratireducens JCM 10879]
MNALHLPRRRLLSGVTAATVALSGCADLDSDLEEPSTDDEPAAETELPDGAITEPAVRTLRFESTEPIVRHPEDDRRAETFFLTDAENATALSFGAEPDGTDAVRSFLDETTFESESVLVFQRPIGECYERRLEYVVADAEQFEFRFCRVMREATVDCDVSSEEGHATFLRVPVAYDERPAEFGGSEGSSCRYGDATARNSSEREETNDSLTDRGSETT